MNPWGDQWGPTAWGVVDGQYFEVWRPERAEFVTLRAAVEDLDLPKGRVARKRTDPISIEERPQSRRLPPVCRPSMEDWLGAPFKHEDSMLTVEHAHVSGVPEEPMLWWEIYRGWEPEAGVLDGWEIEVARRAYRNWAKDEAL